MMETPSKSLCILLPGTDGTGLFFADLSAALRDYSVRVVDYPQSGTQSYEYLGSLLLPTLPDNSTYILIGESFGGPLAIWLALHATHKPAKLILGATFAASPFGWLGRLMVPLLGIGRWLPLWAWQINLILFNNKNYQMSDYILKTVRDIDRRTLLGRVRSVLTCDMRETLPSLMLPVLCLNAARDRLLPPWLPRGFNGLPNARIVNLDLPHMIFQSGADDIVANDIRPFLNEVSNTKAGLS